MSGSEAPEGEKTCVWVSAGLLTYRLCDRDFDCRRCPLDAALSGHANGRSRLGTAVSPFRDAETFPDDRLYTTGHTWLQSVGRQGRFLQRFGIDALAAVIIGRCEKVHWHFSDGTVARGETLCHIDLGLGTLALGAPVKCVVMSTNRALQDEPEQLIATPYERGWMVELVVSDAAELDDLLKAEVALDQARLDLRRFRRQAALHLFADAQGVGPSMADGGELLTDLRQILGTSAYLDLLRELVH